MTIAAERLPDCKVKLDIEVPASVVAEERATIVSAFARKAKIPGYRPGKTPAHVVEKRLRREIESELKERLVKQACVEAGKQENFEILGLAKVDKEEFTDGGIFLLTAEVVTAPDFALPEYKGIEVKAPPIRVTDAQVDEILGRMQMNFSTFQDIDDRPLEAGDFAVLDWSATCDGQPLNDTVEADVSRFAEMKQYWLRLPDEGGKETFLPGFARQIVGLSRNETKDVTITLPENFQPEELQNREIVFSVTVQETKVQELPPIDDDLARLIRPDGSLVELREEIAKSLEQDQGNARAENVTNQILRTLGDELEFELPQHLLFNETQRQVNDIVTESYRRGADESVLKEHQGEIVQNAMNRAAINVKTTFILEEIAKKEGIQVTGEDMMQRVAALAVQSGKPIKKVLHQLEKNNGFATIEHNLRIAKVLEFLRDNATLVEVEPKDEEPAAADQL